jgi:hypothetical protein
VVIECPVEEVFGFFLNLDENAPKVDPELLSVVRTPDGPAEPGPFKLLSPLIKRKGQREWNGGLTGAKSVLEASTS